MKASNTLISSIKRFEGLRLKAYQDAKGVFTIGYGHTLDVRPGDSISHPTSLSHGSKTRIIACLADDPAS